MRAILFSSIVLLLAACSGGGNREVSAETKKAACECAEEMNTNASNVISDECNQLRQDPGFDREVLECFFKVAGLGEMMTINDELKLDDGTFRFDTENSILVWKGVKFTGSDHYGSLKIEGGSFTFRDGKLINGEIVIDMTSLTVDDLTGEKKENLEDHLWSNDFFDIENHPAARYEVTRVSHTGGNEFALMGNMTIKGITKEYTTHVNISGFESNARISGILVIDRSAFDVRFGSNSFFDNLGDKAIRNEFFVKMSIPAVLVAEEESL